MKGKVVLVTGANGGLGTYVTQAFLDAGATVVGTSRKIQQSDFSNPNLTALAAQISTREGAKTLVDQVVARFGKLDVLAHTVGGFAGGQSIVDIDDATFQRMFDLNLNCAFHILRATVPLLRQTGAGRVIAIGRFHFAAERFIRPTGAIEKRSLLLRSELHRPVQHLIHLRPSLRRHRVRANSR